MRSARVRPFPFGRLDREPRFEVMTSTRSGARRWLEPLGTLVSAYSRQLGLGHGSLRLERVQTLRLEELRAVFPGQWVFAALAEPLDGRSGFLGLDPLLLGRLGCRIDAARDVLPGLDGLRGGDRGLLAFWCCRALVHLTEQDPGFGGWRYFGSLDSAGQLGRQIFEEDRLLASWLELRIGWERGFAVWVESERSAQSRPSGMKAGLALSGSLGDLPVAGRCICGRLEIAPAELCALAPGDVLLLSPARPRDEVILRLGGYILTGSARAGGFEVMSLIKERGGVEMADLEKGAGQESAEAALFAAGEIPVELTAELGRVELTVAQLADLRRGDVLPLPDPLLGPVDLRAAGRLVARGEMVDVDGRRGVRVTELSWLRSEADETLA